MAGRFVTYPTTALTRPFADTGDKTLTPDLAAGPGRATLDKGFPTETQLPMSAGGVAPNRTDFNGILNALSQVAFWSQSGGLWLWDAHKDYAWPALVMCNNRENTASNLFLGGEPSGPNSGNGPHHPWDGDSAANGNPYWVTMASFILAQDTPDAPIVFPDTTPVGTVIMYYGAHAPAGYLVCDGGGFDASAYPRLYAVLGMNTTPNMRGVFVRGCDPGATRDPDGAWRGVGSFQGDAIRDIQGTGPLYDNENAPPGTISGAFYSIATASGLSHDKSGARVGLGFQAGRVVPTSTENRPININLLYCIKHD